MATTSGTPERRAGVAGDPIQRFVVGRCATHNFWAEQQFSREDFFERQRHHTERTIKEVRARTHTHSLTHTHKRKQAAPLERIARFEYVRRHLRKRQR